MEDEEIDVQIFIFRLLLLPTVVTQQFRSCFVASADANLSIINTKTRKPTETSKTSVIFFLYLQLMVKNKQALVQKASLLIINMSL